MMNEKELKEAIIGRTDKLFDSTSQTHTLHQSGVLRGLLWALTGKNINVLDINEESDIYDAAGIAWTVNTEGRIVPTA